MEDCIYNNIKLQRNKNTLLNKNQFIFLLRILLLLLFIRKEESQNEINKFVSKIHLVIVGSGNQSFLNDSFLLDPYEVRVNGISKSLCKKFCEFEQEENNITLTFDMKVNNCNYMFSNIQNVKKIDLSQFDFSEVTTMSEMFRDCKNLETINFGQINTSSVEYMNGLFLGCSKLSSIDLSNFDTKNVITFESFFEKCSTLPSLDISNFNSSKVTTMFKMFYYCTNLKTINFGNIDTSSVTNIRTTFSHCEKLESIDISSFNTSSVTTMYHMFYYCFDLTSIIFPEIFDTSKVKSMEAMFGFCKSLTDLNLSTFDLSQVTDFCYMFNNCIKLKYLNIPQFYTFKLHSIQSMFSHVSSMVYLNIYSLDFFNYTIKNNSFSSPPSNLKICATKENMINYLSTRNALKNNNNCSDICFQKNIKLDPVLNECIYSCKDNNYTYECNNICYHECPRGTHVIIKNMSNKINVYDEYDDGVAICLDKTPQGFYLDEDNFYKKCFDSCKYCYGPGNEKDNNCSKCKDNYFLLRNPLSENNCYEKCQNYYFFNETNDYICTENCSGTFDKLIIEKNKCIDHCENDDIYKYEYNKICYEKCPKGTNFSEIYGICIEEKYIDSTLTVINGFSSIINNKITDNIIETFKDKKFSTLLNEVILSTYNHYNDVLLEKTILPTHSDDTKIENMYSSLKSKIIKETTIISEIKSLDITDNNNILTNTGQNVIVDSSEKGYILDNTENHAFFDSSAKNNKINNTSIVQEISQVDFQKISNSIFSSYVNQNELNYNTNFILFGNNEEIYRGILDNIIQKYDISKGEEMIFHGENNFIFHLTNTQNELMHLQGKNNNTNKFSIIDLGECENLLKKQYKINENTSLLIMKYEKITNVSSERSLQYEVYEPNKKTKLNLSICENITIDIYIPVVLSEKLQNLYEELKDMGYDLFDINSPFYHDICTPYTSSDGTDVPLNDRINYYYNNEETICQSNCKFSDYLMESQYLKC